MSTAPPPSQPPPPGYEPGMYGAGAGFSQLPAINGEFVFFVFVWAVFGIIALASDEIGASEFMTASVPLAVAYILSRGIAKLGKVIESR
jgi:hypothetical protein